MQFYEKQEEFENQDRIREFAVGTKKYIFERKDPFGFWFFDKGRRPEVPKQLQGGFTTIQQAERALAAYLNRYGKTAPAEKED